MSQRNAGLLRDKREIDQVNAEILPGTASESHLHHRLMSPLKSIGRRYAGGIPSHLENVRIGLIYQEETALEIQTQVPMLGLMFYRVLVDLTSQ